MNTLKLGAYIDNVDTQSSIIYNNKLYNSVDELKKEKGITDSTEVTVVNNIKVYCKLNNFILEEGTKKPAYEAKISGKVDISSPDGNIVKSQSFFHGPSNFIDNTFIIVANAVKKSTLGNIFPTVFNVLLKYNATCVLDGYVGNISASDSKSGNGLWAI